MFCDIHFPRQRAQHQHTSLPDKVEGDINNHLAYLDFLTCPIFCMPDTLLPAPDVDGRLPTDSLVPDMDRPLNEDLLEAVFVPPLLIFEDLCTFSSLRTRSGPSEALSDDDDLRILPSEKR